MDCASRLSATDEQPSGYAVVVVRRSPRGGTPTSLDLLEDPARLVADNQLAMQPDTFRLAYRTDASSASAAAGRQAGMAEVVSG
jgi:hypothetical protein